MDLIKDLWWLGGILLAMLAALWKLAIQTNRSKERLEQVSINKEAIKMLQSEMAGMKHDISDIKAGVDRQAEATSAMLNLLQAMTKALHDKDCNIGAAQDRFNDFLARR
jgi:hypothetical protein